MSPSAASTPSRLRTARTTVARAAADAVLAAAANSLSQALATGERSTTRGPTGSSPRDTRPWRPCAAGLVAAVLAQHDTTTRWEPNLRHNITALIQPRRPLPTRDVP
jgi:hypothetical protein